MDLTHEESIRKARTYPPRIPEQGHGRQRRRLGPGLVGVLLTADFEGRDEETYETPTLERCETLVNVTAGCVAIASLEPKVPDPS